MKIFKAQKQQFTHDDFRKEFQKLENVELFWNQARHEFFNDNARPFIAVGMMSDGFCSVHLAQSDSMNRKALAQALRQCVAILEHGDKIVVPVDLKKTK